MLITTEIRHESFSQVSKKQNWSDVRLRSLKEPAILHESLDQKATGVPQESGSGLLSWISWGILLRSNRQTAICESSQSIAKTPPLATLNGCPALPATSLKAQPALLFPGLKHEVERRLPLKLLVVVPFAFLFVDPAVGLALQTALLPVWSVH